MTTACCAVVMLVGRPVPQNEFEARYAWLGPVTAIVSGALCVVNEAKPACALVTATLTVLPRSATRGAKFLLVAPTIGVDTALTPVPVTEYHW